MTLSLFTHARRVFSRNFRVMVMAASLAAWSATCAESAHAGIIVTGTNSSSPGSSGNPADWGVGTTVYIAAGAPSNFGTLEVTDGSSLNVQSLILGFSGSASVTVSGGTVTTVGGDGLVVGNGGRSSLLVGNGGSLSSPVATIGWTTANCSVKVTGPGSQWVNSGNLRLGYFSSGNTLTISDGSLVKVSGTLSVGVGSGTNTFLRLDGGYLALFNDQTSALTNYITSGKVQTWNGTDWAVNTAPGGFSLAYYQTDAAAKSFTGYDGLGGYTILTATAVPEPSTYAMALAGLACGGWSMFRRRKRA
jgi:T5SS/PEP-CTERM-associated repeat protein